MENLTVQPDRFYIRCVDCLSIGVVEVPFVRGWHCSICAGLVELMGKVTLDQKHLETTTTRSACDKRCTHAIGPVCVCKCNCANHGTGRVVTVTVLNNLPTIQFMPDGVALAAATTYREGVTTIRHTLDAWSAFIANREVPYETRRPFYSGGYHLRTMLHKLIEARTHKSRTAKLSAARDLMTIQNGVL